MHYFTGLALVILGSACRSIDIELGPFERCGPNSNTRAWSESDAVRIAQEMEMQVPRIRELKGIQKPAPLVVVSKEPLPWILSGLATPLMVLIGPASRSEERLTLVHELAHWFRDSAWNRLPSCVEEGLAMHIAGVLLPVEASWHYQPFSFCTPDTVDLESFREACAAVIDPAREHLGKDSPRLRAIGFVVASSLGIPALRELCERAEREGLAKVPADWIYEALPLHHIAGGSWKAANNRRMNEIDDAAKRVRAGAE